MTIAMIEASGTVPERSFNGARKGEQPATTREDSIRTKTLLKGLSPCFEVFPRCRRIRRVTTGPALVSIDNQADAKRDALRR
ncbi:MAG: hypothetical protein P4M00_05995 [Azospirillaceae bacterium]|nr:hypothetical protein [Azospirillaceae bacterium]